MNNVKFMLILRQAARITSIGIVSLLATFFIPEGDIRKFGSLTVNEILLLFCIPVVFTIGVMTACKKELVGGIIILASVIGFNVIDTIVSNGFSGEIEFSFMMIPGILFLITSGQDHGGSTM